MPLSVGDGDDASFMSDVSDVNAEELEKMIAVSERPRPSRAHL
jgi:hypothetical protein